MWGHSAVARSSGKRTARRSSADRDEEARPHRSPPSAGRCPEPCSGIRRCIACGRVKAEADVERLPEGVSMIRARRRVEVGYSVLHECELAGVPRQDTALSMSASSPACRGRIWRPP